MNRIEWDDENDPQHPGWVLFSDGVPYPIHPAWSALVDDRSLSHEELLEMGYDTINWNQLPNREPLEVIE